MTGEVLTEGHTNPDTLPAWLLQACTPATLGYAAAGYLAGVQVGRASGRGCDESPAGQEGGDSNG